MDRTGCKNSNTRQFSRSLLISSLSSLMDRNTTTSRRKVCSLCWRHYVSEQSFGGLQYGEMPIACIQPSTSYGMCTKKSSVPSTQCRNQSDTKTRIRNPALASIVWQATRILRRTLFTRTIFQMACSPTQTLVQQTTQTHLGS